MKIDHVKSSQLSKLQKWRERVEKLEPAFNEVLGLL
jgi:hypothetical protein